MDELHSVAFALERNFHFHDKNGEEMVTSYLGYCRIIESRRSIVEECRADTNCTSRTMNIISTNSASLTETNWDDIEMKND